MSADNLRVLTSEPQGEGVIELLETLMAEARSGQISSLAVAVVDREGCMISHWTKPPSAGMQIGSVARLLHRLNVRMDG